jgi:hypothetical protein
MKKFYALMVGLLIASVSFAQPSYYVLPFINVGSNPGNLNNDDENPGQPGWNDIFTSTSTDAWSTQQSIPFPFQFAGNSVSNFFVSNTGVLTFETTAPATVPGVTNAALPSTVVPNNSVCAWGLEISGSNDAVRSKTFGSAPNRQLWVSWVSASAPEMSGNFEWAYWSIVLEEGTNKVYVVDQRTFASSGDVALTVGIQVNNSDFTQLPASPNVNGTTNATSGSGTDVTDNTVYEFNFGTQPQYDLSMTGETVPEFLDLSAAPFTITGDLVNLGSANVSSFDLNYTVNGGAPVTASVNANVSSLASYSFSHPTAWSPSATGTYTIEIYASNIDGNPDQNNSNDRISLDVIVYDNAATRQTLMEVFTSSTCPPCLPGNQNMDNVVVPQINNYTIVKYQQDFPGAGDPYVTQEAVSRRNYYGVNSIPRMELDGQWDQNAGSLTVADFNQFQQVPAFLDFTLNQADATNTTVDINYDINVMEDYPSGNYRAQTVIVEKRTTGNVASNGETEFFYVMMDMIPNDGGTSISGLTKGNTINVTETVDLAATFVEDMWDLKVVVWVENTVTKEVMNSAWYGITQVVSTEENELASASIYPNPAKDFFTVELEEKSDFNVTITSVTGQIVMAQDFSELQQATINTSNLVPGVYMVNVNAGSETTTQRVVISK